MIKKLIVESLNRIVMVCNMLDRAYTEEEVREVFAKNKTPIRSLDIDTVGVALVTVEFNYYP